jgi:hypothetical protein
MRGIPGPHDPGLIVRRPQRSSCYHFAKMLVRYGRGKERAMSRKRAVGCRSTVAGSNPGGRAALPCGEGPPRGRKTFVTAWLGLAATCRILSLRPGTEALSTIRRSGAPSVPFLYAIGQLMGFMRPLPRNRMPASPCIGGNRASSSCSDTDFGATMPRRVSCSAALLFDAGFRKILRDERADILRRSLQAIRTRLVLFAANFRFDPSPFKHLGDR